MNKIILLIFTVISFSTFAQQSGKNLNLSLLLAIDLGLKNRYDIQANSYNLELAENNLNKSRKEWIPDINGTGNIRYNPQIQSTLIPAGFVSTSPQLFALGAKNATVFGLDLNQPIFKPSINTDIKIARNNIGLEGERNKQKENDIRLAIVEAYLNVLLKEIQSRFAITDEQRFKEYAEVAEGRYRVGTLIENDYLKSKLDYENAKLEALKAKQNYTLAIENIRYQMNIPGETTIVLTDSLSSLNIIADQLKAKSNVNTRTEIKQLELVQQGNSLEILKNRQSSLPSLSFYANYSQQFLYNNFDYAQGQWWSPFSYLGLKLNVPITARIKNYHGVQEYKLKSLQTELELKQKETDITYETQKATIELSNALNNMQITKANYDLSETIYQNQKKQYNLGTLLYNSLLDTEKSLTITEQNYIKAIFDYLVANVNYQRAVGNY